MEAALHARSLLAAGLLQPLSENSRPGHQLSTVALYPGIGFVNSNTATGLRVCLHDDRIGSRDTGKERDSESGLDYFGARYYGSALGRFTSPDWSEKPEPVPYADLSDPQTLNLYSYTRNNPLTSSDIDGHCTVEGQDHGWLWCAAHAAGFIQTENEQAADARQRLSQMHGFTINGQSPSDFAKNAGNQDAIGGLRSADAFLATQGLAICGPGVSCGVLVPTGGLGPVLKGAQGVEMAAAEIEAEGGQVVAREVTIENSAGRARVDVVYRDSSGNLQLGEAKNGPTAGLNPNQQRVYAAAQTEGAKLVGGNAQNAGLPSTVAPGSVRVFKY